MIADSMGASDRWIPEQEYKRIKSRVPILCVDVLLLSIDTPPMIGLIQRDTYDAGRGWCLVGGAVLRDEPLAVAVKRHVEASLGGGTVLRPSTLQLHEAIEYFTNPELGEFHDPRKHAVALTYSVRAAGFPSAQGEALAFRWFRQDQLAGIQFGFGQGRVVERILQHLDLATNEMEG
jgi:ADP-ribose pyrophosphatase YjhB (NUDIX family)